MTVAATVLVSASFADDTSSDAVSGEKRVALGSSQSFSPALYLPGKVIFLTGTCGTAGVTIDPSSSGYVDSNGETVSISNVRFIAFCANPHANLESEGLHGLKMSSQYDGASVSHVPQGLGVTGSEIEIKTVGGFNNPNPTATYSVVVYGEN